MKSIIWRVIGAAIVAGGAGCFHDGARRPAQSASLSMSVRRPAGRAYLNMPPTPQGTVPALLSQTGAFEDVRALKPVPGLLSYDLNVPFWSDGAEKRRWIAIPPGEKIDFAP